MSRVGKRLISVPENAEINIKNNLISIKGPLGELNRQFSSDFKFSIEEKKFKVEPASTNVTRQINMMYGTVNSLIQGMIIGVTEGFIKELEIIGVGYNVKLNDNVLTFSLGYSHKIDMPIPEGLKAEITKNELKISGIDKQLVGQFSAQIKKLRKPEPYGGKGIRYKGEKIIRKAGKSSK